MLDFTSSDNCHNPFPQESELYFRVAERELGWKNERTSEYTGISKQKALIRAHAGGGVWLANVGENYKLIENKELFPHVEQHLTNVIDSKYLHDAQTVEHMSYNGRDCYREYRFPSLKCEMHGQGNVAFRVIVGNSYGGKAVTLLAGAIDFFCTNGMLIGQSEKQARKHTSNLEVTGLDDWITDSVRQFAVHGERIGRYTQTPISELKEDALFDYLVDKSVLSARRADDLRIDMYAERNSRNGSDRERPTLWHLYSALTDWSSHSDVRDTGNDHEANTRIQRTQHAERVIRAADQFVGA
jgi:hypothetical protein